jgi:hypothetical protein
MRTGFSGPSSKKSMAALYSSWCESPSPRYSNPRALPITRSGGIPYISPATGRMKSRSPAEAMYVTNPFPSR